MLSRSYLNGLDNLRLTLLAMSITNSPRIHALQSLVSIRQNDLWFKNGEYWQVNVVDEWGEDIDTDTGWIPYQSRPWIRQTSKIVNKKYMTLKASRSWNQVRWHVNDKADAHDISHHYKLVHPQIFLFYIFSLWQTSHATNPSVTSLHMRYNTH